MIERYDLIGGDDARQRQPGPRIARQIRTALGYACSVFDVGTGAGT
jgi:hypothetical protein